jgi:D-arabinose 1-dehydrogenase
MTTSNSTATQPRGKPKQPLSSILPPLIFGTGTFNTQFNADPYALNTTDLVYQTLARGVRAFDTSPYYGPSEILLGEALNAESFKQRWKRHDYFILTKCGRIDSDTWDFSPQWVRQSVGRSLERFRTGYLDVVYCHDVEFASPEDVIGAVKELRRLRDEDGSIRYVGISGYPLDVLCSLAERIREETGEPLDVVQSYANFTLQNTRLATEGVPRLKAAGVDVVTTASLLSLGLLRGDGLPRTAESWHPAPRELREAVVKAATFCKELDEKLEAVAIRYAVEGWMVHGSDLGALGDPSAGIPWDGSHKLNGGRRLGVAVMGASTLPELDQTLVLWRSILDGLEGGKELAEKGGRWKRAHEWSLNRRQATQMLAEAIKEILGEWYGYTWDSPPKGWVNKPRKD